MGEWISEDWIKTKLKTQHYRQYDYDIAFIPFRDRWIKLIFIEISFLRFQYWDVCRYSSGVAQNISLEWWGSFIEEIFLSLRLKGGETLKYRCVCWPRTEKFNTVSNDRATEIPFTGKFGPKNQNCQFKLKFCT